MFDVQEGQSGNVWFLTGPFGTIERDATIPAGKALFVALINVDSSTLEAPPFYGATAADQLAIANGFADFITDLSFTVRNTGGADLAGLVVTLDGPDAAEFSVSAAPPALRGGWS